MRKFVVISLVLLLTLFAGTAVLAEEPEKDIVDTAIDAGDFDTLVTALTAAELVEALRGDGPFTVFAPTDDAFAALPDGVLETLLDNPDILTKVLLYHVVEGAVMAADAIALDGESVATLEGQMIDITADDGVFINDAEVVAADIECTNGVIHAIDSVLLPEWDIVETAILNEDFDTLTTALGVAGLVDALKGDGPFTVFAPTDDAFAALPDGVLADLLADPDALGNILLYHVVPGSVSAADVIGLDGQSVATLSGAEVLVSIEDGAVFVDGAQVIVTDIECTNGMIHVIDAVMVPADEDEEEPAPVPEPEEDPEEDEDLPRTGGPAQGMAFLGLLSAIGGAYLVRRRG